MTAPFLMKQGRSNNMNNIRDGTVARAINQSMPKIIIQYVTCVDYVSTKVGRAAMYLIFVMIGTLLLDAITRNIINIPLSWCVEMAQFTMAAYYILGGAYSMQLGDHVRMDLIYDACSEKNKARLDVVTSGCMLFYLSALLYGSLSSTIYAIKTGNPHPFKGAVSDQVGTNTLQ